MSVDADGYFGVGPMQDCDAVQCSNPFKMAPFVSDRICAQLLMFARVFCIYGTKSHVKRWLMLECIKPSTRKCEMHCQWETHNGYHHSSHHRGCHSFAWRRRLVRPGTLVRQVIESRVNAGFARTMRFESSVAIERSRGPCWRNFASSFPGWNYD